MGTLVRQELYKLYKKKSTVILFGVVAALMILIAVLGRAQPEIMKPEQAFSSGYSAFSWLVFILIAQAATIITMEFQYGTIKNLLYRKYSRTQVLVSKWIALLIHSLILFIGSFVISILLKTFINSDVSFSESVSGGMNAIERMLATGAGTFVSVWLLISLVLLLSTLFKSTAVSTVIGIIFYFAASIVSGILFLVIDQWEWMKWNPLNMMNFSNQIITSDLESSTHLSIVELLAGNLVYIAIFLFLVYLVFRKKKV